jgi:hypothetical protein
LRLSSTLRRQLNRNRHSQQRHCDDAGKSQGFHAHFSF